MKKLLLLILMALVLGLAGCSPADKPNTSTPSTSSGGIQLPDQPF